MLKDVWLDLENLPYSYAHTSEIIRIFDHRYPDYKRKGVTMLHFLSPNNLLVAIFEKLCMNEIFSCIPIKLKHKFTTFLHPCFLDPHSVLTCLLNFS